MRKYLGSVLILTLALVMGTTVNAQEVKLERWVVGSGGWVDAKNSANIRMSGLTGQVAIEKITQTIDGKELNVYQGFWVPMDRLVGIEEQPSMLSDDLMNFPNPFSNSTVIRYELPGPAFVSLKVYDVNGQLVKLLLNNSQSSGMQEVRWDATDLTGTDVGSGSYLYELNVRPAVAGQGFSPYTKRNVMVVVK